MTEVSLTDRLDLSGRTLLVTGAAAGIGAAAARAAVARGARAILVDIDAAGVHALAAQLGAQAQAHACDVSDFAAVQALAEVTGPVDLLVNAAGNVSSSPFLQLSREEWDAVLASHVKSVFNTCRVYLPGMAERQYGRVVNVASVAGKRGGGILGKTAYAGAKAAVNGLSKALARELAPAGVRVNAINPGVTDTRRVDVLRADPEVWQRVLAAIPLGRPASADEVAAAIVFLLSDASRYITGTTLNVDGGMAME